MKIYSILPVMLCIILLVSCDDSENQTQKRSEELSKVYRDEALIMTLNNQEIHDKAVEFRTHDLNTATLSIRYLIPGESPLNIKEVELNRMNQSTDSYSFVTSASNSHRDIQINGSIGDKMNMDIQLKVTSPLAGIWAPMRGTDLQGPLELRIVPGQENATINMHGILGYEVLPVTGEEGFNVLIKNLGGLIFGLITINLDLKENSKLVAHWKSFLLGIPASQSDENMVRYNVVNDRVFAAVAIDKLLFPTPETRITEASNIEIIIALLQSVYQGIPLNIAFTEDNNTVQVSVTKEMMIPYLDALVELALPLLADIDLGDIGIMLGVTKENLPLFIGELVRVIKESKEFDIQLNITRTNNPALAEMSSLTDAQLKDGITN